MYNHFSCIRIDISTEVIIYQFYRIIDIVIWTTASPIKKKIYLYIHTDHTLLRTKEFTVLLLIIITIA